MDIKYKIEEIIDKVKSDKDFAYKFSSDPVKALESVLGIDLPDDQIKALIDGVKAKAVSYTHLDVYKRQAMTVAWMTRMRNQTAPVPFPRAIGLWQTARNTVAM